MSNLILWSFRRFWPNHLQFPDVQVRLLSLDYGRQALDGAAVEGRTCRMEISLGIRELEGQGAKLRGFTVGFELVVFLPSLPPGDRAAAVADDAGEEEKLAAGGGGGGEEGGEVPAAVVLSARLISFRRPDQTLMSGKLRLPSIAGAGPFSGAELDLERIAGVLTEDIAWMDVDLHAATRLILPNQLNVSLLLASCCRLWTLLFGIFVHGLASFFLAFLLPSTRPQLVYQGRVYPLRAPKTEKPVSIWVTGDFPKPTSSGEAKGNDAAAAEAESKSEDGDGSLEVRLYFSLKPKARKFDVKRLFGSIKTVFQFAAKAMGEEHVELLTEDEVELPRHVSGNLEPSPEKGNQRCMSVGIRIRPGLMRLHLDQVELLQRVLETGRVSAGVTLDLGFGTLCELLAHCLTAKEDSGSGDEGARSRIRDGFLSLLQETGILEAATGDRPGNDEPCSSLAAAVDRVLERERTLGPAAKWSDLVPSNLSGPIKTMDRGLDKVAEELVSVQVRIPSGGQELKVLCEGMVYSHIHELI